MRVTTHTKQIIAWIRARLPLKGERGAGAVEYGILAAMIAAAIIVAVAYLGSSTQNSFECTEDSIATRTTTC